ncbi:MAG TPA: acyltransferase family protein [Hyphomicrobiaceae bacterium]|nr:acyltransferase family protein [Hyphomicrobiaceae bacterium]
MQYRKDIDGLRAVAVLAVVMFHAKIPGFSGGFVGVDVFFVISGYLITGLIAHDYANGSFTFSAFYFRRSKRILPALACIYVASTLLASLVMLPSDMASFGRSLTSSALFYSNHFFYTQSGYFGGPADLKPLLHTWSLSIEEQFYLVWPILFLLLVRWRAVAPFLWPAAAISLAACALMTSWDKEAAFFLAPFRAWELLLGAGLALLPKPAVVSPLLAQLASSTGLAMVVASIVLLDEARPFPGLLALAPCLGAALLVFAGTHHRPLITRLLSTPPAVALGLISYSLYLWHWPLLSLARYHFDRPLQWGEVSSLLGLSLLAAFVSYRWVERPARNITWERVPQVLVAGVVSLGLFVLVGNASRRWTFSLNPEIRRLDDAVRSENTLRRRCSGPKNIFRDDEACTFGRPRGGGSYDVAIFGDSHANHYTPAIELLAQQAGMSGRQITVGGCLALLGYYEVVSPYATEESCRSLREAMVHFVRENPSLRIAVLAHNWSVYAGKAIFDDQAPIYVAASRTDERSQQRSLQVLRQSLEQTIDFFQQRGIHVVLLGEVAIFARDPVKCIAAALRQGGNLQSCRRPLQEVRERLDTMNNLLSELATRHGYASFISPLAAMCDNAWCSPVANGVYMYRDRSHLNRVGAEQLVRSMRVPHLEPRS